MLGSKLSDVLRRESNTLLLLTGVFSGAFLGGGYYFSMREKYEKQVAALELQLEHEKNIRELRDDFMLQKFNHERDRLSLSTLHLRRLNEHVIHQTQIDQQRWYFDLLFHGDYELFRTQVAEKDVSTFFSSLNKCKNDEEKQQYSNGSDTVLPYDPERRITLKIKDHNEYSLTTLDVPLNTVVGDLKYIIEDHLYIPAQRQRLFFNGTKINDGPSLSDYEIKDGSTLHLEIHKKTHKEYGRRLMKKNLNILRLPKNLKDINSFFDKVDRNKDKTVSLQELESALKESNPIIPISALKETVQQIDTDHSGYINHKEWYEFCINYNDKKKK